MPFATKELNEITYLIQRFEQTYIHKLVDKSVEKLILKQGNRRLQSKQKRKQRPSETL